MLSVSDTVKQLYKNGATKNLQIYFPILNLTLTSANIISETFSLTESICSDEDLIFGSCEASKMEFATYDISTNLSGYEFLASHIIGGYSVMLGRFVVDSCKKQDNKKIRKIVAYDIMTEVDADVADWYNSLTFPMTLAAFRLSFLNDRGIIEDTTGLPLPNDTMQVNKTLKVTSLDGRKVIEAIEEINGVFGHINRGGAFSHIILKANLSANINETITKTVYGTVNFEPFTTLGISKLRVYGKNNSIYATAGTGTNTYLIEDNFLVYDKTSTQLSTIAANAYTNIGGRSYRPYDPGSITCGLAYLTVGDIIAFDNDDGITSYILNRTMEGIKSLHDTLSAPGTRKRKVIKSVSHEIAEVKGKTEETADTLPKPVTAITVNNLSIVVTTENETITFTLTKDSSGRITSVSDGVSTMGITWNTT